MANGKNGGVSKNSEEWMKDKRRLNESANEYAARVADEFWQRNGEEGYVKLTKSDLAAIARDAFIEGREPPKDVTPGG